MNASDIIWDTQAIIEEVRQKFPQHADLLGTLTVRVSNRMTRGVGKCSFRGNVPFAIVLSFAAFQHDANKSEMRNTVLHEIAHAIAGIRAGHGWQWQQIARMVGARPERCVSDLPVSPMQYVEMQCSVCQQPIKATVRQAKKAMRHGIKYRHKTCRKRADFLLSDEFKRAVES